MHIASVTNIGKRKKQQDTCAHIIINDVAVLVVADGNGEGGRQLSASSAKATVSLAAYELAKNKNKKIYYASQLKKIGLNVIKKAAKETSKQKKKYNLTDAGTTLTLVIITSRFAGAFWIGDSQAAVKQENTVTRLTAPVHTLAELLIKTGLCKETIRAQKGLNCILTRCIGGQDEKPDYKITQLSKPATFFAGSDGFFMNISDTEIQKETTKTDFCVKGSAKGLATRLVKKAVSQNDGDNCTLIVAHIPHKITEATT